MCCLLVFGSTSKTISTCKIIQLGVLYLDSSGYNCAVPFTTENRHTSRTAHYPTQPVFTVYLKHIFHHSGGDLNKQHFLNKHWGYRGIEICMGTKISILNKRLSCLSAWVVVLKSTSTCAHKRATRVCSNVHSMQVTRTIYLNIAGCILDYPLSENGMIGSG